MAKIQIPSQVGRTLAGAHRLVALTGAGISAESGVPTFRGAGGLWSGRDPTELATPEAFDADPALVWDWYAWRRRKVASVRPNPGHLALVELERRVPGFLLVTQNVDGLHRAAGSSRMVELHGDLWTTSCRKACGYARREDGPPPELGPEAGTDDRTGTVRTPPRVAGLPRCPCGALLRPGVVWFGEALPEGAFETASRAARSAQVVLVIGTSSLVWPAAGLSGMALSAGAEVIEVNPEPRLSGPGVTCLAGPAGEILPQLAESLAPAKGWYRAEP